VTGLRIGLIIVGILGVMYAAAGLMSSLTDFGVGAAVVAAAVVLHGLVVHIEESESKRMQRFRDDVWARREEEW
jgi:hypothetical protein